ncbi:MAG TPA: SH3 domain-containing protein [Pseudonocardiaceae bacterium]|nr:SH3 domain-containing protein [Pseudonocardiaceae bacterium]
MRTGVLGLVISQLTVLLAALMTTLVTGAPAAAAPGDEYSTTATDRSIRCARAASAAGWTGSNLVVSVAISLAESWCTANAQHYNGPEPACPNGSLDRGAWQINNCHQSWVSDACAYELYCNARAAFSIYGWSGWGAWTTYLNGDYRNYLAEAQAGVDAIGGAVYGTVTTGGGPLNVRAGPSTSYALVGTVANGTQIRILCQARGQWVYSEVYGIWTDLWDKIGTGRYVSDAYVYTGSDGQVAPTC